mgnify:CR=1 FL=1
MGHFSSEFRSQPVYDNQYLTIEQPSRNGFWLLLSVGKSNMVFLSYKEKVGLAFLPAISTSAIPSILRTLLIAK